jgi:hypothetical protein
MHPGPSKPLLYLLPYPGSVKFVYSRNKMVMSISGILSVFPLLPLVPYVIQGNTSPSNSFTNSLTKEAVWRATGHVSVSRDVRNSWAWLALQRWPWSSCTEIVFLLREVILNSAFQNIRPTNYAIPFTTSDSSICNSNKYCSWFRVLTTVLILLGYDAMPSDQVTNRQGIISQKTCFFNKLPFIWFAVNVISWYFIVTQPPTNAVICEQFSQYCVLNF